MQTGIKLVLMRACMRCVGEAHSCVGVKTFSLFLIGDTWLEEELGRRGAQPLTFPGGHFNIKEACLQDLGYKIHLNGHSRLLH